MKYLIYYKENELLVVSMIDTDGNPILTTNEGMAMLFDSESDAYAIIDTLNPAGDEFWGTRPPRPK